MQIYSIIGGSLILYMVLAWFVGSALNLQSPDIWILRIGLSLVGIIGAATFAWYYRKEHPPQDNPQAPAARGGTNDIDSLLKHADAGLATSRMGRGTRLRNLPVFLVLGDSNAAKTTTIAKSGLEPELVAGQIYTGTDIIPTQFLNCWLMQGSVFIEPGNAVHSDPRNWSRLIGRLRSKSMFGSPAPRAVLLCFPLESLRSTGDSVIAAARRFRAQLEELAQTLGIRVPTYVVFTKLDQVEGFTDYMAHFTDAEVEQVLGATLPLTPDQGAGLYADRMTQTITAEFQDLVVGLSDLRIDLLQRQREMSADSDSRTLSGIYEFPREFRKIRDNVVHFLVELCRPSQLRIGPFLRGFYFCGVRAVTSRNAPVMSSQLEAPRQNLNATSIFRPQATNLTRTSQPANIGSSRIPQWIFLYPIFSQLLLKDHVALGTSRASSKANLGQRIGLAAAASLALIAVVGMAVSFFGNHSLLSEVTNSIALVTTTGKADAARSDLAGLDTLSQVIRKLEGYNKDGPPWRLRWGLYVGHDAYTRASHIYSSWFDRLLLQDIQRRVRTRLSGLPGIPTPENDSKAVFEALKAHLLLTSERSRADAPFLSAYLFNQWTETHRSSTPEVSQLVKSQFEFFAERLNSDLLSPAESDANAVQRARRYLRDLGSTDRIYQAMLADAGKNNPPIQFNQRIPGSADVIRDNNYSVKGEFTKAGWKAMQEALQNQGRYSNPEQWVLGQDSSVEISKADIAKIRAFYISEYKSRWRQFLTGATMVRFGNLNDAVSKLRTLQGEALLGLFLVVAENTAMDMDVKRAFQGVHYFVSADSPDKLIGPANMGYINALIALQVNLGEVANQPAGTTIDPQVFNAAVSAVLNAKTVAAQVVPNFGVDSETHIERTLRSLIEQPITMADSVLRSAR